MGSEFFEIQSLLTELARRIETGRSLIPEIIVLSIAIAVLAKQDKDFFYYFTSRQSKHDCGGAFLCALQPEIHGGRKIYQLQLAAFEENNPNTWTGMHLVVF